MAQSHQDHHASDHGIAYRAVEGVGQIVDLLFQKAVGTVAFIGGVAANGPLRARFEEEAARLGLVAVVPPKNLCTDNGAVIAAVGDSLLSKGVRDDASLTVSASREAARARR